MKLSPKEIKLLFKSTKRIKRKNFVGILVVHYSEATKDDKGRNYCTLLVDSVKNKQLITGNLCDWRLLKEFKCNEQNTQQ